MVGWKVAEVELEDTQSDERFVTTPNAGQRFAPSRNSYPQEYSYYHGPGLGDMPVIFIVLTFFLMFIFLFLFPMVLTMNTSLWLSSESILKTSMGDIDGIKNIDVREAITGTLSSSSDMFVSSQGIIGFVAQWGWFFIIAVAIITIVLLARKQVETGLV